MNEFHKKALSTTRAAIQLYDTLEPLDFEGSEDDPNTRKSNPELIEGWEEAAAHRRRIFALLVKVGKHLKWEIDLLEDTIKECAALEQYEQQKRPAGPSS